MRSRLLAGLALVALTAGSAAAQNATWNLDGTGVYNTASNWTPNTVPFGTAFFGTSNQNNVSFSEITTVGGWIFSAGAPNYSFINSQTLQFTGAGIQVIGGSVAITNSSLLEFFNTSTAGSAIINNNNLLQFYDTTAAGDATIANNSILIFKGASTAGSASITNTAVSSGLSFNDTSTAGNSRIINNKLIEFFGTSTAGNALITNNSILQFNSASTAGNATITSNNLLAFFSTSTAGNATITNTEGFSFNNASTAGNAKIDNNNELFFFDASTAGNATITTNSGAKTYFENTSSGGTARLIAIGTGAVDFSLLTSPGTTAGSFEGSGKFLLGSKTITVGGNNVSTTVSGVISDGGNDGGFGGALVKEGTGKLTLAGANTYTGVTTINAGALIVDGSIAPSILTRVNGGTLGGSGTVGSTQINAGGSFAPGAQNTAGSISVAGNLAFQSGALYFVQVDPATASRANVTGTATLAGAVRANFAFGPAQNKYSILHADGGLGGTTFGGLTTVNLPANFLAGLSYDPNNVYLNLTAALGLGGGLPQNPQNVATAINGFFNNGGTLPANFLPLFNLTGTPLANALSLLTGEAATGAQQIAFQLGNQFLALMLDPLAYGRNGAFGAGGTGFGPSGVALSFAAEEALPATALAYAKAFRKEPPPLVGPVAPTRPWNVWAGGYGGATHLKGDPTGLGSNDLAARTGGYAAGLDYRLWPGTVIGFALGGGFTDWTLARGLGGGKGDAFQAGLYGVTQSGPAYLAGAASFTQHWMDTDRTAFAGDRLTARFDAQSFGGRLEGGWRFATFLGGVSPYAAVQAQAFRQSAFSESDPTGGGFGLSVNGRTADAARSELGARFEQRLLITPSALLAVQSRAAWAHDWTSDPTVTPVFQTLPGASFVVNGATPATDLALLSAGAELRFLNGWSLGARFDGEFASRSQTYAGTGALRYVW